MSLIQAGEPVLLVSEEGKRYLVHVTTDGVWYTHRGQFPLSEIIGHPFGQVVTTHRGQRFLVLRPTTSDLLRNLKRITQIVFPKDAARLVMELDLWDGRRIIEAGSGSGGLTMVFARAVMPSGTVVSYEARPEHQKVARANITRLGLQDTVDFKLRDVAEGFDEQEVDAVFLDVRDAAAYVPQAEAALTTSAMFGAFMPTVNQVSDLVAALEAGNFVEIRVEEIMLRSWKPVPNRLRPTDRMVAHTGFLIFARKIDAAYRSFWYSRRQRRRDVEFGSKRKNLPDPQAPA